MIRIKQVKINIFKNNKEEYIKKICNILNCNKKDIIKYEINKRSIDARDKNNIHYVYEFDVETKLEEKILKNNKNSNIIKKPEIEFKITPQGKEIIDNKIVIVGSGPAGLFCSYLLTSIGYKTLTIERGDKIEKRIEKVRDFFEKEILDTDSNIQFGEGGAGTFSDGKLNTLVKDKNGIIRKVYEIFVECGAPSSILIDSKPHIGTDMLRKVIVNMRNKIISMGGEFRFNSKLTDITICNNKVEKITINQNEEINCNILVLAIGHSARDTFKMLHEKNVKMENKRFAVGVRIIHLQEMISKAQYGKYYKYLPPASYKLTHKCQNGRGVYSFCMCPGGYVVNASSENGGIVVNGMSNYNRDNLYANSAIVCTVSEKDYGTELFSGLNYQRELEKKAYKVGDGKIPVQYVTEFINNTNNSDISNKLNDRVLGKYNYGNINEIFSKEISDTLKEGLINFNNKIPGFIDEKAVILAIESRTSCPIRIIRNEYLESNISGIYPCGEGAGYAGGITTSAVDGIKVAQMIADKYMLN